MVQLRDIKLFGLKLKVFVVWFSLDDSLENMIWYDLMGLIWTSFELSKL